MPTAADILPELAHAVDRQVHLTELWHREGAAAPDSRPDGLAALIQQHHRANFDLWHQEDLARDPAATDADIAAVKRRIDRLNQQRNDLVERIDEQLAAAAATQDPHAQLHSETPGAILDRLSILTLKIFHTREEIARPEASATHRVRNQQRLAILERQHRDLLGCLLDLWKQIEQGHRRFQVYRQMKMYNDPDLNPVLRRASENSRELTPRESLRIKADERA